MGGCVPLPPPLIFVFFLLFFFLVFFFFSFGKKKEKTKKRKTGARVHCRHRHGQLVRQCKCVVFALNGAFCGWPGRNANALCPLACVVGAVAAVAPQGCGSRLLMYTGLGQGGFGEVSLCFWSWLVRRLCGLWVWAVVTLFPRRAWLEVKG